MLKYDCYECGKDSSASEWNKATQGNFPNPIVPIEKGMKNPEYYGYICPKCFEYVDGHNLKLVKESASLS